MKVKWTPSAKKQWRDTAKYIQKKFGVKVREAFMQDVLQTTLLLGNHPKMGVMEPFLADLQCEYRSFVVNRLNKIVYRLEDNVIYIVAFWDTRKEPQNQAQQLKDTDTPQS